MIDYIKIERDLLAEIALKKSERQESWDKERATTDYAEKRGIQEKTWALSQEINELNSKAEILKNITACLRNGGELIEFTDKLGMVHKEVCDFRGISTDNFDFKEDEEILDQPHPEYIPYFDESDLKRRGFMVDAIRIDKDSYLLPTKAYSQIRIDKGSLQLVVLNLDQLVLTLDYYHLKAIATNKRKAREQNERNEKYFLDKPLEDRERYYNQRGFYQSMPAKLKKKISEKEWNELPIEEKQELYLPVKRTTGSRITSKLRDKQMYVSFADLYLRFVDPTKTVENYFDEEIARVKEKGFDATELLKRKRLLKRKINLRTAHPDIFKYFYEFRDAIEYKLLDIQVQRVALSETYQKGFETSYGRSGTDDRLFEELGILVKRQNGEAISVMDFDQIREGWKDVQKVFGNLKPLATKYDLVVSHASKKYQFANKRAIGIFIPRLPAIGVSSKYGETQFKTTMAHEVGHFIDFCVGQIQGLRYSTDDFEGTSGKLVTTFRNNMNIPVSEMSGYIKCSKECFARAFEQYFSWKLYGFDGRVEYSEGPTKDHRYFENDNYVSRDKWGLVLPLIEQFLDENKDVLNYTADLDLSDSKEPIGEEEAIEMMKDIVKNDKVIKGLQILKDRNMDKKLSQEDIESLNAVIESKDIPEKWKKEAKELVGKLNNEENELKKLELEKLKLINKSLKMMPQSKEQLEVRNQIDELDIKINKLKKPSSEKQQLEDALKGIQVAIDLAGETEELKKAKKGIEVALSLISDSEEDKNIIDSKVFDIFGNKIKIEMVLKTPSANQKKLLIFANGKEWTSWNLDNFIKNKSEEYKDIKELLEDGSYKMFI